MRLDVLGIGLRPSELLVAISVSVTPTKGSVAGSPERLYRRRKR